MSHEVALVGVKKKVGGSRFKSRTAGTVAPTPRLEDPPSLRPPCGEQGQTFFKDLQEFLCFVLFCFKKTENYLTPRIKEHA